MKIFQLSFQFLLLILLSLANTVYANDIIGNWQVSFNGKTRVVAISKKNQQFIGTVVSGKKHFGKVVLTNLKADSKQQYSGGKIINPINGMTFNSDIVVNGDTATVKIYKGVKGFGITQVWQRQK